MQINFAIYLQIICGGGPCGLMLANELGSRGISTVLIDDSPSTTSNAQASATQARTMEHYRRLGFAKEIRSLGLPADYHTDVAYFTRFTGYELARFPLPASGESSKVTRKMLSGSWSAAELPHRISQMWVEKVLLDHALKYPSNSIHFNHELVSFSDGGDAITAQIQDVRSGERKPIRAQYLVGTDGLNSLVRRSLGIEYVGEATAERYFMGGRMLSIHLNSPQFYNVCPHDNAWMYVTINQDRRAYMIAVNGTGEFELNTQLQDHEDETKITKADALSMFQAAVGKPINAEILSFGAWETGRTLLAKRMHRGRAFLAGDSAHSFTPTGGMGYNTGIEDAVNLGWKLATVIRGRAPESLLSTYENERRPIAERNGNYARQFADALGNTPAPPELETDTEEGAATRKKIGDYYNRQARQEFDIPGVTFGYRYDDSPIICPDGTVPPPDVPNVYIPSACPGGRAPHFWLGPEGSLYDEFGPEWTLLRCGERPSEAIPLIRAAKAARLDLKILDLPFPELRYIYEADFALIRPDQIVAWRGNSCENVHGIITTITGGTATFLD
ncbi:MAG: FAD-dependent oxidoreductase [Alphaproteobacteria bacterium]